MKIIYVIYTVSPAGFEAFVCYYDTFAEARKYVWDHKNDPDDHTCFVIEGIKPGNGM